MCGRVAYLHVAFPCHIAKVCEKLWILNRFFCTNPVLDNKERAGERRPPSFRMAVRVWGIDYIAISACNLYLNLRFFFFYDNDIAVPLFTVIRIWKCKTVCKKKTKKRMASKLSWKRYGILRVRNVHGLCLLLPFLMCMLQNAFVTSWLSSVNVEQSSIVKHMSLLCTLSFSLYA